MIKGLGFRVYDLIKLVIKTSICTLLRVTRTLHWPVTQTVVRLLGRRESWFIIFLGLQERCIAGEEGAFFKCVFVCLFVPLFLCASEQQYREFVSSSSSSSSS
jgi:hypothetical protein